MTNQAPSTLQALSHLTTIVADTGDIDAITHLKPTSATTNPSLITAAVLAHKVDPAHLAHSKTLPIDDAIDYLTVALGADISRVITGQISTEVDAKLSYNTDATLKKAYEFIELYQKFHVNPNRVLIKIASTQAGIKAAEILEKDGIGCNLTLLFSGTQARACADAGVTLISPFVGRITDFQKKHEKKEHISTEEDWGVLSVKNIYNFYKTHGYSTQVMGASFRHTGQILALAGCDLLTIAPALLEELDNMSTPVHAALTPPSQTLAKPAPLTADAFLSAHKQCPWHELLDSGIAGFIAAKDTLAQHLLAQR